ncbi:U-box domain-containing protein 35 [Camellia lanceoleosa]|uniref:U-box domain-containing protein 35 n=1 Tax=Camellia lanceoleosa TaxID=1840588 RepID=A0ACC0GJ78_9ERIC|nr:U-box domain-containing protein 35 [Camellia lanceoleosa]
MLSCSALDDVPWSAVDFSTNLRQVRRNGRQWFSYSVFSANLECKWILFSVLLLLAAMLIRRGRLNELQAEMRRLRDQLKQMMEMYNSVCKEAISSKEKAKEIDEWKPEEERNVLEAKQAEEAAMALAEMEKQETKVAIEAALMAQRLPKYEIQMRKSAEMKAIHEVPSEPNLDALACSEIRYRKYPIKETEVATDYFSNSLKIGEGGYGPVYKAFLDHTPVAIKVLRSEMSQGKKQFQREVEVLSYIRHPSMVLLLGACPEYGCLVYEYMENGSLEDRLFRKNNSPPLPWKTRFRISAEVTTALLFLHRTKPQPLVHRDLKPANILLNRNYVSKISDVGLARLVPPSVANGVTQISNDHSGWDILLHRS